MRSRVIVQDKSLHCVCELAACLDLGFGFMEIKIPAIALQYLLAIIEIRMVDFMLLRLFVR